LLAWLATTASVPADGRTDRKAHQPDRLTHEHENPANSAV
jgi:hypothetical protein